MGPLSLKDCRCLASLHRQCLPDSIISELAPAYAEVFYRYLSRSAQEQIFVVRDDTGEVFSGCVLSLQPKTLKRRLLFRTSLLWFALPWLVRRWFSPKPASGNQPNLPAQPDPVPEDMPELLLIFTQPQARSRGSGAALLRQCEQFLTSRGCLEYAVRTSDDPGNRALDFYARNGFSPIGRSTERGHTFRVFKKGLPSAPKP